MTELEAAVAAARRVAETAANDGAATRRRIRESLEHSRDGRTRRLTIIGVLAATIFGSTAFAYRRVASKHVEELSIVMPAPAVADEIDIEPPRLRERTVVVEEPPAVEPRTLAPALALAPALSPPPSEAPVVEAAPQADPELAAYRIAYDAHFHGSDPTAALSAWDAYLASYPAGKLATDARYNRAIILVKLKHYTEAADALRPLAETNPKAKRLLDAMPR